MTAQLTTDAIAMKETPPSEEMDAGKAVASEGEATERGGQAVEGEEAMRLRGGCFDCALYLLCSLTFVLIFIGQAAAACVWTFHSSSNLLADLLGVYRTGAVRSHPPVALRRAS